MTRPIFIVGATASGKSSLALDLAETCHGEIVNADAFQLYEGLDTLTAKPAPDELTRVPHHLYGVLDVRKECHAGRYQEMASTVIAEIQSRGKIPIIVGGSGLYIKTLTHGLPPLPQADEKLRAEFEAQSLETLVERLRALDAESAKTIDLQNRRYVTRALEISILAGEPASKLRRGWDEKSPADITGFLLHWDRAELNDRIAARTQKMFEDGNVIQEVRSLKEASGTASKAIGVREIQAHLRGESSLEECVELVTIATRQYAKRQSTWFRREKCFQTVCLSSSDDASSALQQILKHV